MDILLIKRWLLGSLRFVNFCIYHIRQKQSIQHSKQTFKYIKDKQNTRNMYICILN